LSTSTATAASLIASGGLPLSSVPVTAWGFTRPVGSVRVASTRIGSKTKSCVTNGKSDAARRFTLPKSKEKFGMRTSVDPVSLGMSSFAEADVALRLFSGSRDRGNSRTGASTAPGDAAAATARDDSRTAAGESQISAATSSRCMENEAVNALTCFAMRGAAFDPVVDDKFQRHRARGGDPRISRLRGFRDAVCSSEPRSRACAQRRQES
jgi:hypothetical protein